MLVHRRVTPSVKVAGIHLYTWVERGTVGVNCPRTQHNVPGQGLNPGTLDPESGSLTILGHRAFHYSAVPLFRCSAVPLFHCSAIPLCKNSKLHSVRRLYVSVLAHCFRSLFSVAVQSIFFLLLLLLFLLDPRTTLPPELHRSLKQRPRSKIPKERTN